MSQFVVKRTFKVNTGKGKYVYYLTFGYEILATVSEKSSLNFTLVLNEFSELIDFYPS